MGVREVGAGGKQGRFSKPSETSPQVAATKVILGDEGGERSSGRVCAHRQRVADATEACVRRSRAGGSRAREGRATAVAA